MSSWRLAVGLVALVPSVSVAQVKTQTVAVRDTVLSPYRLRLLGVYNGETGAPMAGVEVANLQSGVSSTTNASGVVMLSFLPDGGGLVRIRKMGYAPVTTFVSVSPTDTTPVTEVLSPQAVTLPGVTTQDSTPKYLSPALRGFEQRRHQGLGHFITEAELRKKDDVGFHNVIAMLPGLMIYCPPSGHPYRCYAASTRLVSNMAFAASKPCFVSVYQDGVPVVETDLTRMHTYDYGAVEFYAGGAEIPPEYNMTGNSCGVLLLWSRER